MHGWHVYEFFFDPLLKTKNVQTVIEVGSFLGNWAAYIADRLPTGSVLYAVDHWLGSDCLYTNGYSSLYGRVEDLYNHFLSNMIHRGITDKVVPIRMESTSAAEMFRQRGISADIIYIDASHDYESVKKDLHAWLPVLKADGVFCGDDWTWGGVQAAVTEFAQQKGFELIPNGSFWEIKVR